MSTRKRPPPNPLDPDSDSDTSSPPTSKKRPFQQKPPPTTTTTTTAPPPQAANAASNDEDDEDDYMNMTIAEPTLPETFSQRKKRLQLEAETRARPKSKAELAALEKANRDAALAKSLLDTQTPNKGLLMMRKMGFTPGSALGAPTASTNTARLEPIPVTLKEDRTGIGHASAQRAKLAATAPPTTTTTTAAAQLSPEDYRARVAEEQEERRREAQLVAAQKLAEEFECERSGSSVGTRAVPLRSINVLWRGLVKRREEKERERRMRYDLLQSLDAPRLPGYDRDCELDEVDKAALGITVPGLRRPAGTVVVEDEGEEGDEVDEELEREEARSAGERVAALCEYLRRQYRYCFWCKCRYEDEEMEGCPGVEEDLHG
ncbi:uncharacterized protein H6S33_001063 [Morchella sextelata]|uniref:uncharacterized protein n=1 Tax=Morchella sextelata TaxID=1174677 RepID=UPI001D0457EF|nr:uncharacterized protein H6S33_001063 [Morchella sextelata]KAH0608835.1 hypothetical protein H6S33_001063 [Morchella sextelata]